MDRWILQGCYHTKSRCYRSEAFLPFLQVLAAASSQLNTLPCFCITNKTQSCGGHPHACRRAGFLLLFASACRNAGRQWGCWLHAGWRETLARKSLLCLVARGSSYSGEISESARIPVLAVSARKTSVNHDMMFFSLPPASSSTNSSTSYCLYCVRACSLSYKDNIKGNNFSGVQQNLNTTNAINSSGGVCARKK